MKIRDLTILLATSFGTIAAASMIVTVVLVFDNRGLRQEMRDLRRSWDTAAGESQRLKLERSETENAFTAQGERLKQIEAELVAVRSSVLTNAASAPQPARAHRAAVYLGQQYLGQGWVAPGQAATDPNTGQVRHAPIVLLDPAVRAGIAAGKTNVVEREVASATTVNHNYPYPYYDYWWYPSVWTTSTNGDGCARPERPPQLPPPPSQTQADVRYLTATRSYTQPPRPLAPPVQTPRMRVDLPIQPMSPGRALPVSGTRRLSSPGN